MKSRNSAYRDSFVTGNTERESLAHNMAQQLLGHSSVNYIASEDAAGGWRRGGRMSSVRRFFCLFCTFDFLFTVLLWIISVMLTGESIADMWKHEVLQYHINSSLLDVVGVAAIRFILLLIAYAAFHMDHWIVVALTTSGTCTFLIAKVFIFDWLNAPQPVFQVLLILLSFSLCWGEAWFLDCKVLPQEALSASLNDSQRSPIPYTRESLRPSDMTSIGDFYSPAESPEPSPTPSRIGILTTASQDDEYQRMAQECEEESMALLHSPGWGREKVGPESGDLVESMRHPSYGKIYKLTGIVDIPADDLFYELTENLENISTWNPTIIKLYIIKQISEDTSLTYQVTTGGPKNAVKPRDFVCVRRISKSPSLMITSSVSIEHPQYPPNDQYIRGHNNVGCWQVTPHTLDGTNKTMFQWLMACDLKGWLPQYVLDIAFSTAQLEFLEHLRAYAASKKRE